MIHMKTFPAFVLLALLLSGPQPLVAAVTVPRDINVAAITPKLAITHIAFTPAAQKKLTAIELKYLTRFFKQLLAETTSVTTLEDQLTLALKKLGVVAHTYQQVDNTSLLIDIQKITPLVLSLEIRHNNLYSRFYWDQLLKDLLSSKNIQQGRRLPVDVESALNRVVIYLQKNELWNKQVPLPRAGGIGSKISFYVSPYDDEAGGRVSLQVHLDDKKTTHIMSKNVIFEGNQQVTRDAIIAGVFKRLSLEATIWPQSIQYYYQKNLLPTLKDFYRKHGYVEMNVVEEKFIQPTLASEPKYLISLNEGPQYTTQKVLFYDLSQTQNKLSEKERKRIQQIITDIPTQYAVTPFQDTFAQLVSEKINSYLDTQDRIGSQVYVQQLIDQPTKSMQCVVNIRAGIQAPIIHSVNFQGEELNLIQARANFNIKVGQPYQKTQMLREISKLRVKNAIKQADYVTFIREDNTLDVIVILVPFPAAEKSFLNGTIDISSNTGIIKGSFKDKNIFYSNLPFEAQVDMRDVKLFDLANFIPNLNFEISTAVPTFLAVPLRFNTKMRLQQARWQASYGAAQQFFLSNFWNWTVSYSSTVTSSDQLVLPLMNAAQELEENRLNRLESRFVLDTSRQYQESLILNTQGYNLSTSSSWCTQQKSAPYLDNVLTYRHYYAPNNRVIAYLLGSIRKAISPSQSQLPFAAVEQNMIVLPGFQRDQLADTNVIIGNPYNGKALKLGNDNSAKVGINLQLPCSGNFREMANANDAYITMFLAAGANVDFQRKMFLVDPSSSGNFNHKLFYNPRASCGVFLTFATVPFLQSLRFGWAMPIMGAADKTPSFRIEVGIEDPSAF